MAERLCVEVVFADVARVFRRSLLMQPGATVADAIRSSGVAEAVGADIETSRVGVFGRRVSVSAPLRDGDRVEIYRPLKVDPKEARRRRAKS